jgi:hypothetical protein
MAIQGIRIIIITILYGHLTCLMLVKACFYKINIIAYLTIDVKRETNKVDRAKRMHCMRSERAITITPAVHRL